MVIDGEVLRFKAAAKPGNGIQIRETTENIVADGTTYREARIYRYAEYVPTYTKNVPGLYPASGFSMIETNDQLAKKLLDYTAVNSDLAKKLTVLSTDSLTRVQLDAQKDNVRLNCRKGCFALNGAEEYTINVYRHSANNITQEQILPDLRRYVRYWNSAAKTWGGFYPVTENLHIDVKVVKGSTVYVRHGFIPEGVQLVLLRKKKRSRKRRSGGTTGTNAAWKGKSMLRQPKNQYVHYKGVILSTSSPNNWYVPKCIGVTDKEDNALIGKELGYDCGKRESVRNRRRERPLQSGRNSRQSFQERHKAQDTGLLLCADRVAVCRSREDVQERGRRDGAYEIPPLVSSRQEDQQDRGAPWVLCRLGTKKRGAVEKLLL